MGHTSALVVQTVWARDIARFLAACRQSPEYSGKWRSCCWINEWILPVADSKRGAAAPPLLTGCILKQGKILRQNAWLLDKILKIFLGRGHSPLSRPLPLPVRPLFQTSLGSATEFYVSVTTTANINTDSKLHVDETSARKYHTSFKTSTDAVIKIIY